MSDLGACESYLGEGVELPVVGEDVEVEPVEDSARGRVVVELAAALRAENHERSGVGFELGMGRVTFRVPVPQRVFGGAEDKLRVHDIASVQQLACADLDRFDQPSSAGERA